MNRNAIQGAVLCGAIALVAACQHHPDPGIPAPPQQVQTGSRFALRTPLEFPTGDAGLLFQNEQVVAPAKLSREMPYCRLRPDNGGAGTLPAGKLTVGSVNYDEREAGTAGGMVSVTRIALATAPDRPGYTLSCGWPQGASGRGFVNTQQIFNAIGGQFSMDLLR